MRVNLKAAKAAVDRFDRDEYGELKHDDLCAYAAELCVEVEELRELVAKLRAACEKAMLACQDNLKMYAYKNEPVLSEAYWACRAVLEETFAEAEKE